MVFFGLLIACVIAGLVIPAHFDFLNPANLTLILRQIPAYGMVALGVGLLMITGEFDLSVGSVFVVAPFAMGYAASWVTRWFAFDAAAQQMLGARGGERFVGFVHIGTPTMVPEDRDRPVLDAIVSSWEG